MPTPEENKEAMETLRELGKAVDDMTPEERADHPGISRLEDGPAKSIFTQEELPEGASDQRRPGPDVKVTQGAGSDGMEDSNVKDILRELVGVAKSIQIKLTQLGQE